MSKHQSMKAQLAFMWSAYLKISDHDAAAELLQTKQYLNQYRACRDEYETLRELSRLSNGGGAFA